MMTTPASSLDFSFPPLSNSSIVWSMYPKDSALIVKAVCLMVNPSQGLTYPPCMVQLDVPTSKYPPTHERRWLTLKISRTTTWVYHPHKTVTHNHLWAAKKWTDWWNWFLKISLKTQLRGNSAYFPGLSTLDTPPVFCIPISATTQISSLTPVILSASPYCKLLELINKSYESWTVCEWITAPQGDTQCGDAPLWRFDWMTRGRLPHWLASCLWGEQADH